MILCSWLSLAKLLFQKVTRGWICVGLQRSVTAGVSAVAVELFRRYRWKFYLCCISDTCSEEDLNGSGLTAVRTDVPPKRMWGLYNSAETLLNNRLNTEISNGSFSKPNSYKQLWPRGNTLFKFSRDHRRILFGEKGRKLTVCMVVLAGICKTSKHLT